MLHNDADAPSASQAGRRLRQNQFSVDVGRVPFAFERQVVVAGGYPLVELIVIMRTARMA